MLNINDIQKTSTFFPQSNSSVYAFYNDAPPVLDYIQGYGHTKGNFRKLWIMKNSALFSVVLRIMPLFHKLILLLLYEKPGNSYACLTIILIMTYHNTVCGKCIITV